MQHKHTNNLALENTIVNFLELDDMRIFINNYAKNVGVRLKKKNRKNYYRSSTFYIGRGVAHFDFHGVTIGSGNKELFLGALEERYPEYIIEGCYDYVGRNSVSVKLYLKKEERNGK